jgi:hypothetical protein
MKKQVVFIHGGQVYDTYEEYIEDLKTFTVDPFLEKKRWRVTLKEVLGTEYEVLLPEMPNKMNAKYLEWEIWFDKHVPFLRDSVILVGHSLGASFFLRYLSERALPVSIRALYLVAAPYFSSIQKEGGDFRFDVASLRAITEVVEEIVLVHSSDDEVVPFGNLNLLKETFSEARIMEFGDRGHFNQELFPELIEDIKSLE